MKLKKIRFSINTLLMVTLFIFTFSFMYFCNEISKDYYNTNNSYKVSYTGSYTINGEKKSYPIPENHRLTSFSRKIESITFKIKFNETIAYGQTVNLFMNNVRARIYKNDVKIYSYGYDNSYPDIVSSVGKEWYSFDNMGISKNDEISITLESTKNEIQTSYITKFLDSITVATYRELLKNNLEQNSIHIIFAGLIFIMGFVLLVLMLTFKVMNSPVHIGDFSCSFLMMSGALAVFFNYDYITLFFRNAFIVNMLDYVNHMFILYFMLMYFRLYVHGKAVKNAVRYFFIIWTFVIIAFFMIQSSGKLDYIDISKIIVIPAIIIISFTILFLFIDYSHIENPNSRIMIGSGIIMCITSLSELLSKVSKGDFLYYSFEVGLIIFSIIQFIAIMIVAQKSVIQASRAEYIENELLQSKISIMLSQIQPHFLYNTLVVIRQLCDINPKLAKEAVTEFASYLRGNLDSLTLNTTISFEKEMEHVENYVSLEKKRFGDRINIDYDIEATEFEVPSLTIQTIVENSIRHGITKRKEGGTVTITTRENAYNYTIEIMDNGIGINTSEQNKNLSDNRSHIGVENARKRIETMCNGTLDFSSTPNVGTTVLITIPKKIEY